MEPQAFEAAVKGAIDIPWKFDYDIKLCAAWSTVSVFDIQVELADWGARGSVLVSARVGGSINLWRSRNETEVSLDEVLRGIAGFLDQVASDLSRIRNKKILKQSLETMKFSQETRATIEELIANLSNES